MWYARRYRKKYPRLYRRFKRYGRGRRGRGYARRRVYKARRAARLSRTTIRRNIVSDVTRVKLRSDCYLVLDNTTKQASIFANNSFPDPKFPTNRPMGYKAYITNYSRFVIKACRIKMSLVNQSTGMNALYIIPIRHNAAGNGWTPPSSISTNDVLTAYPNSKRIILPPGSSNAFSFRVVTHYMGTQKLFGYKPFNNDTWDADREIDGVNQLAQSALEDAWDWLFIITNVDDATVAVTGAINATVELTQYYEFRGRSVNPAS